MNNMPDQPDAPEHPDLPLNANGPAYTSRQDRYGIPLDHVAEKLGSAIEELHRYGQSHANDRAGLLSAMHYALVAHLGLHNMLGKANDRTLASRLLNGTSKELDAWLQVIAREGDVHGLATLDRGEPDRLPRS